MIYEDGDIYEVFEISEHHFTTKQIGEEVADLFSKYDEVDKMTLGEATDEIGSEFSRVIFDIVYDILEEKGIEIEDF